MQGRTIQDCVVRTRATTDRIGHDRHPRRRAISATGSSIGEDLISGDCVCIAAVASRQWLLGVAVL